MLHVNKAKINIIAHFLSLLQLQRKCAAIYQRGPTLAALPLRPSIGAPEVFNSRNMRQ